MLPSLISEQEKGGAGGMLYSGSASVHSLTVWAGLPLGRRALKLFGIKHKCLFQFQLGFHVSQSVLH